MLAVFNKELKSYFNSATGYIFMGVFLLFFGVFFAMQNLFASSTAYTSVIGTMQFVMLLVTPILTMRIISEETHQKTDQLLYTSPLKLSDIVIGKYLAAFSLYGITVLITCLYPFISGMFGILPVGEIIGAYIGLFLLGAALIAVGVFISALTENQVVAAVGTLGAVLFLWIIDSISQSLPTSAISGIVFAVILVLIVTLIVYFSTKNIEVTAGTALVGLFIVVAVGIIKHAYFEGFTVKFFGWLSLMQRFNSFSSGILNLSDIVYDISFVVVFLFLTTRMIEKKRWS
ncbi:MAG TPA: ABC transporter permease [Clostridiaceae bacterium]